MTSCRGVSFVHVDITSGFWQHRQALNRTATIHTVMQRFADTGRFAALNCNWREGEPNKPHIFWDSDVAKWMESVGYLIQKSPMPELEAFVEKLIDSIEAQQGPDGYFNSYFTTMEPCKRWTERAWHELYCAGHLIEAAIAWKNATGRDRFLKIMCRYADYIDRVFRLEGSARFVTPGHQEIELALVKLYHATGEKRYLDLSVFFIDNRGRNDKDAAADSWSKGRQAQDHAPCAEQTTAEGHAVRAAYMYAAMADIARERGDEALLKACKDIFDNIVTRRMYITAGVGSTQCGEAYTRDYHLPNETAYTETCASIALAFFAQRMLLLEPNSKYADVIERVLYNGFLASTSLDGRRFFYSNPMEIDVDKRAPYAVKEHEWLPDIERVEVFSCSCCPPNITRFVASVGDYLYTANDERIYMHQYMANTAQIDGATVQVETCYPADGLIRISASGLNGRRLCLRIPQWCSSWTLSCPCTLEKGYAILESADCLEAELLLDMPVVLMESNPNVADNGGKAAVMRGPVVYCMEAKDNGERIFDCMINAVPEACIAYSEDYRMPIIKAKGWRRPAPEGDWLYRPLAGRLEQTELIFIPYYAMANRGESDMRVWIPVKY